MDLTIFNFIRYILWRRHVKFLNFVRQNFYPATLVKYLSSASSNNSWYISWISWLQYSTFQWLRFGSVFFAWNFLLLWLTEPFPVIKLIVLFNNSPFSLFHESALYSLPAGNLPYPERKVLPPEAPDRKAARLYTYSGQPVFLYILTRPADTGK